MQTGVRIITPESRRRDGDSSGAPGTQEPGWKGQLRGAAPGPGGAGSCEKEGGLMRSGGAGNEKF